MRGETDPNETKGAQQLKQQNGMGRLGERQASSPVYAEILFALWARLSPSIMTPRP